MIEAAYKSMAVPEIAFELKHITKLYAGTVALEDVSISVNKGEVHGIIGKNGAGKSTLVGILSGIIPPTMGEILVNGHSFRHLNPITAKKHHISIITQEPQVISESSVAENLFMPEYLNGWQIIPWAELAQRSNMVLEAVGFPIDPALKVRELSISEKQLLLVIKSCYVENADIIIMDEVSASLTKKDENTLYGIIRERSQAGKTVIFISHHTSELLHVCDKVTVLRDGHSVGCYACSELDMPKLAALIVGDSDYDAAAATSVKSIERGELLFELKNFTNYGKFQDINLRLYKGEIVGLAGLRGSGRTELFKSIVGIDSHDHGAIFLKSKERRYRSPAGAQADGVMYMPEEREAEGLIPISSIKKNLTISILPRVSKMGLISSRLENTKADSLIRTLDIKAFSHDQNINQLSGGNKQKVLVGKIMAHNPLVCLLDEPTRGVDVGAKDSILNTINEEMRLNSSVLLSSPGVDDLLKICDRKIRWRLYPALKP
jgi:ABC-type sugar transport system ATPase subunit